jgi:class 3 adenylate cyclase
VPSLDDPSILPTLASVIFARITEFARRPVAEQARLRAQLEASLAVVLIDVAPRCRIILDAPDGVAVAVLDAPATALDIAERWRNVYAAGVSVAIAVNHGAVRMAADDSGHQGMIGDAVGTAAAIAHFAGPSRLFVSRTFRDALAERHPARAVSLRPAGVFTDANVRTHELYSPDPGAVFRRRKVIAAVGLAAILVVVATILFYRDAIHQEFRGNEPAVLAFDINPEGDVLVDRIPRGKSPPLRELELTPGPHNIEVRRKNHPPFRTYVDLEAGRRTTVEIAFSQDEEQGFFHRLRNWFGKREQ